MYAWQLSILLVVGLPSIHAEEVLFPASSEDAKIRYGDIGQLILDRLRTDSENVSTSFNVLLYAGGCTQYESMGVKFDSCPCMEHATRDPTNSDSRQPKVLVPVEGYTNVNAFTVTYDTDKNTSKALRDEWKRIEGRREEILKKTFNDDEDERGSLPDCILLGYIDRIYGLLNENGFRAVAAFRCARRFVWYELGWTYFEAYWTNSEFILNSTNWATSWDKGLCGTIVFFP